MRQNGLMSSLMTGFFALSLLCSSSAWAQAEKVTASEKVTEKRGVSYYLLDSEGSVYVLNGYDSNGQPLVSLQWYGGPETETVEYTATSDGLSVSISCANKPEGATDCVVLENGREVGAELSQEAKAVLATASDYMADILSNNASTCGGEAMGLARLTEKGRRVANGICYIAGICAGAWPIGTAICGPTALGCAVMYFGGWL